MWSFHIFNPLVVWNNPFGVDVPLTEKPGGLFPQAGTEKSELPPEWIFK